MMVEKLYAIQRPDGTIIQDSLSDRAGTAWVNTLANVDDGNALLGNKRSLDTWSDVGERLGYRCVEAEVVKAGRVCEWEGYLGEASNGESGTFWNPGCRDDGSWNAASKNNMTFCPHCGGKIVEAEDGKKEGGK